MGNQVGEVLPVKNLLNRVYGDLAHVTLPESVVSGKVVLQGCLPLLMEEVSAEDLREEIGQTTYEKLYELYKQSSFLNMWYEQELHTILECITMKEIDVVVLKGADLAATVYPHPALRHYSDVDIMVHATDFDKVIALLEECGYHYHQEYRFESSSKERAAFLYVKQVTVGYVMFEVHTSPHVNEMRVIFDTKGIWARKRLITVGGVQVYGMGLEDLLLYCCWHYRSHTFSRLIWLYDIAMLLQRHAQDIDWEFAYRLAHAWGLSTTVYYCVRWCEQIFDITLPDASVLLKFQPNRHIQRIIRSRLHSEPSEVILRHSATQERKWLQRMMVDDFASLCVILLRILFPSPTHLGRHYMEHSVLPLRLFWLYYFIHPFIVLQALLVNPKGPVGKKEKRQSVSNSNA
jgi:hypothetical protein